MIPSPWEFALLTLATYRLWRLIAEDDITARLRNRWQERSQRLTEFVSCPWCLGAWIAAGWIAAWWISSDVLYAAAVFAVMAGVGVVATVLNSLTPGE